MWVNYITKSLPCFGAVVIIKLIIKLFAEKPIKTGE
jgi:hypothetical protein